MIFSELRNIDIDEGKLDPLFYETRERMVRFAAGDQWIRSNGIALTICLILRFIDDCSKDEKTVKFIPWACVVGQKMAKKIVGKLEFYKNEENLRLGQGTAKTG